MPIDVNTLTPKEVLFMQERKRLGVDPELAFAELEQIRAMPPKELEFYEKTWWELIKDSPGALIDDVVTVVGGLALALGEGVKGLASAVTKPGEFVEAARGLKDIARKEDKSAFTLLGGEIANIGKDVGKGVLQSLKEEYVAPEGESKLEFIGKRLFAKPFSSAIDVSIFAGPIKKLSQLAKGKGAKAVSAKETLKAIADGDEAKVAKQAADAGLKEADINALKNLGPENKQFALDALEQAGKAVSQKTVGEVVTKTPFDLLGDQFSSFQKALDARVGDLGKQIGKEVQATKSKGAAAKQELPINKLLDADGDKVTALGEKIGAGEVSRTKGAIDVVRTDGGFMVLDGQHRAFEAFKRGDKTIGANLMTKSEAMQKYGDRWPHLDSVIKGSQGAGAKPIPTDPAGIKAELMEMVKTGEIDTLPSSLAESKAILMAKRLKAEKAIPKNIAAEGAASGVQKIETAVATKTLRDRLRQLNVVVKKKGGLDFSKSDIAGLAADQKFLTGIWDFLGKGKAKSIPTRDVIAQIRNIGNKLFKGSKQKELTVSEGLAEAVRKNLSDSVSSVKGKLGELNKQFSELSTLRTKLKKAITQEGVKAPEFIRRVFGRAGSPAKDILADVQSAAVKYGIPEGKNLVSKAGIAETTEKAAGLVKPTSLAGEAVKAGEVLAGPKRGAFSFVKRFAERQAEKVLPTAQEAAKGVITGKPVQKAAAAFPKTTAVGRAAKGLAGGALGAGKTALKLTPLIRGIIDRSLTGRR